MMNFARTDKSTLGRWWWTIDGWFLSAVVTLMIGGVILSMAASPAIAQKMGLTEYHFFYRQVIFFGPALALIFLTSLLSPRGVRRLAALMFVVAIAFMIATLLVGPEKNGAQRWLFIGSFSLQPSEFVKPALIVLCAWLFAEANRQKNIPGNWIAIGLLLGTLALLVAQPDFGQATLVSLVWGSMFFLAGLSWLWIAALGILGMLGLFGAYLFAPHVSSRVDRFMNPESGDTYQVDTALSAFANGGLFGRGPGEGRVKQSLPDAHTDYIFAVVAEEYGLVLCLILIGLFAFIVVRGLSRALSEQDQYIQLGACGLVMLFGFQALINLGVNVHLLPSKGMTLPFISYGGSSLLALALTIGMTLALTRRRAVGNIDEVVLR